VDRHAFEPRSDQPRLRDSQRRQARAEVRIRFGVRLVRAVANEIERAEVLGGGADRRNEERKREDYDMSKD
jgi:hypothetical protein